MDANKIVKGEEMSPALVTAMDKSMFWVVVLSKTYASSTWCLDELVQILKCKKDKKQTVLPIFYGVNPSDVREQKGSFAKALAKLEEKFQEKMVRVQIWKQALAEVANISDRDARNRHEPMLVKEIIQHKSSRLINRSPKDAKAMIGADSHLQNTMEVVGEALLSTAVSLPFDKLASSDLMKFARQEDVHTELKKWEKELQSIWQELNDAEEKQIAQEAVKSWLIDLRDLAYDMEDILDEFAYEVMRRKLMGAEADEASTSMIRKFIPTCCTGFNPTHVVRNVKMGPKIREITSRLQDISARKAGLGLEKVTGAAATSAWQRSPPTTPIAYEPGVYGKDEDKKVVLDLLGNVEPYENNVDVISIIGMGVVGKTTLARLVYNDEEMVKRRKKLIQKRGFVCLMCSMWRI